jgi:hypothetical protein
LERVDWGSMLCSKLSLDLGMMTGYSMKAEPDMLVACFDLGILMGHCDILVGCWGHMKVVKLAFEESWRSHSCRRCLGLAAAVLYYVSG